MEKIVENIGVDSGSIMVGDISWKQKEPSSQDLISILDIPNGTYQVKINIPNTWNGNVQTEGILKVTSGKIVVCDPCYISNEGTWDEACDRLDSGMNTFREYFQVNNSSIICDNMGGDGSYKTIITFTKIN